MGLVWAIAMIVLGFSVAGLRLLMWGVLRALCLLSWRLDQQPAAQRLHP
jgi:hypothetical protein